MIVLKWLQVVALCWELSVLIQHINSPLITLSLCLWPTFCWKIGQSADDYHLSHTKNWTKCFFQSSCRIPRGISILIVISLFNPSDHGLRIPNVFVGQQQRPFWIPCSLFGSLQRRRYVLPPLMVYLKPNVIVGNSSPHHEEDRISSRVWRSPCHHGNKKIWKPSHLSPLFHLYLNFTYSQLQDSGLHYKLYYLCTFSAQFWGVQGSTSLSHSTNNFTKR